jgi:recombination protein RecA
MPRGKKKNAVEPKSSTAKTPTGFDIAKKAIQKKYGSVVSYLSDHEDMHIPTLSTGSLGLDIALGRGGMGLGRVYEIYGNPSGGKTTLALSVLIQAQKRGMSTAIIDAEHALDPALVKSMGAKTDDILVIQGYSGEDNLDAAETLLKTSSVDVVVVDSVSALIPRAEADAEMADAFIGLHARLMSKALRKITPIANETNTLVIFINQIRYKVGALGNPESPTGGEALPFFATGRISVKGAEYKSNRIIDPVSGEAIGHHTKMEVVKNKLAPPFRKATVPLIYGRGFDLHWEALTLAISLGIIDRNGAWYKYGDRSLGQGEENVKEVLKEDADLYEDIREKIIFMTGLKEYYESNK